MEFPVKCWRPKIRTIRGEPVINDSPEAVKFLSSRRSDTSVLCKPNHAVRQAAVRAVKTGGGDVDDELTVLGQYECQFGMFKGKSFLWILSNAIGWCAALVENMQFKGERESEARLSANKFKLKEYLLKFDLGRMAVEMKAEKRRIKDAQKKAADEKAARLKKAAKLKAEFVHKLLPPSEAREVRRLQQATKSPLKPNVPARPRENIPSEKLLSPAPVIKERTSVTSSSSTSSIENIPSEELLSPAPVIKERTSVTSSSSTSSIVSAQPETPMRSPIQIPKDQQSISLGQDTLTVSAQPETPMRSPIQIPKDQQSISLGQDTSTALMKSWKETLPPVDQDWVSRAFFKFDKKGQPQFNDEKILQLWHYPPQPKLIPHQPPPLERYFGHRVFLWMPHRLRKIQFRCPYCPSVILRNNSVHHITRMVLDVDDFYILITENLRCKQCLKYQTSWSDAILSQLTSGLRAQFPVQIMQRTACDDRVVDMLRQRSLGNSPSALRNRLLEMHQTAWTRKTLSYLTDCAHVKASIDRGLLQHHQFAKPPDILPIPTYQWFLAVYGQEMKTRDEEVKASLTSTFGRILKLDSTKKITKKLAGEAARTANWCTSVSNEHGQVLMCVMTASEGRGIEKMLLGLVERYRAANEPPPQVLYVDCNCCGPNRTLQVLRDAWPNLAIRLDIWHFMRRLSVGVSTDTHRLYKPFMADVSKAIFSYVREDFELLKAAKRRELELDDIYTSNNDDILARISRAERSLHCRRTTRGTEETTAQLDHIMSQYGGDAGRDTMGVHLFNQSRMPEIWKRQRAHIPCLQDVPDVALYCQTGTLTKGELILPTYRCARGSTSIESFHLHLARFIPGDTANATNFQNYLLDGMSRWNDDRFCKALGHEKVNIYNRKLKDATNQLSERVLDGYKIFENFMLPNEYTGELIGLDYLFSQTGSDLGGDDEEDPEEAIVRRLEDPRVDVESDEPCNDSYDDPTIIIDDSVLPLSHPIVSDVPPPVAIMMKNRPSQKYLASQSTPTPPSPNIGRFRSPLQPPTPTSKPPQPKEKSDRVSGQPAPQNLASQSTPTPPSPTIGRFRSPLQSPTPTSQPPQPKEKSDRVSGQPAPQNLASQSTPTPPSPTIGRFRSPLQPPTPTSQPPQPKEKSDRVSGQPAPQNLASQSTPTPPSPTIGRFRSPLQSPTPTSQPPQPKEKSDRVSGQPAPQILAQLEPARNTPSPAKSPFSWGQSDEKCVGPNNIGGYDGVMKLVACLSKLHKKDVHALTNHEAKDIVSAWSGMSDFDRSPTLFKDRYTKTVKKGRFKQMKHLPKNEPPAGTLSVKRCSLSPTAGPATWPDCNRYVEGLILDLCRQFPGPVTKEGKTLARWDMVIRKYRVIRQMVTDNALIRSEARIQLPELNVNTIQSWHSARAKQREEEMLVAGLDRPDMAITDSPVPGPKAVGSASTNVSRRLTFDHSGVALDAKKASKKRTTPKVMTPVPIMPRVIGTQPPGPLVFFLPGVPIQSTGVPIQSTGVPIQSTGVPIQSTGVPIQSTGVPIQSTGVPIQSTGVPIQSTGVPIQSTGVPVSSSAKEPPRKKRKTYTRTKEYISCPFCGEDRKKGGHTQIRFKWYCPKTCGLSFEQWKRTLLK